MLLRTWSGSVVDTSGRGVGIYFRVAEGWIRHVARFVTDPGYRARRIAAERAYQDSLTAASRSGAAGDDR